MKILAIDQSFTSSGIVVFKNDTMLHCERYITDKQKDKFERAWELAQHIKNLAKKFKPKLIALEGLAFGSNGDATRDLAGLQFTIVTLMRYIENYDVRIYPPQTVKKVATGKGNSKKDLLLEKLPENIREEFDNIGVKKTTGLLDLTDAYWIGIAALEELKNEC